MQIMFYKDDIKKIVNALKDGDSSRVHLKLQYLAAKIGSEQENSIPYIIHVLLHLIDEICQYVTERRINIDGLTVEITRTLYNKNSFTTIDSMIEFIHEICDKILIEQNISSQASKQYNRYVTLSHEYIHQHYHNFNLSLNMLANLLGVNNTYLSKLHKDETKMNISEYIAQYRIQKAKELLNHGSITIREIGHSVGFTTVQSFIRTFKRYEHITPGEYVKQNKTIEILKKY